MSRVQNPLQIDILNHFSTQIGKADPHARQYSLIVQALLKTTVTHVKKRELHLRSRRKQASSQLFGMMPPVPSDTDETEVPTSNESFSPVLTTNAQQRASVDVASEQAGNVAGKSLLSLRARFTSSVTTARRFGAQSMVFNRGRATSRRDKNSGTHFEAMFLFTPYTHLLMLFLLLDWTIYDADFFALPWLNENDQGLRDFLQPGTHNLNGASMADIPLFPMYNQQLGEGEFF